ncbi:MAG TPA: 23S rRNA (adenine(1618)-N(6))-methyltransferase RlmF [Bacteriovoracaceae bacterium]|nr:23S rRNA (adenine(1618)-N(6))-methyltransferase RlmF [Bacteriovoracaceae bacterium]
MASKPGLHPRNLHKSGYDFDDLLKSCPQLAPHVFINKYQAKSIDFSDAKAVRIFNQALLKRFYGIEHWELPPDFLCPPVPGRADYIHHLRDLLPEDQSNVRVLDVGTGANCIYPLLGLKSYGWTFVASDIDPEALLSAERIIGQNPGLSRSIELRHQCDPQKIFSGVLKAGEFFDLTMCNPPFHDSAQEALKGTQRKWKSLGKSPQTGLNFGGKGAELWCEGGEVEFIKKMIVESSLVPFAAHWFTTLVSKESNLQPLSKVLARAKVAESRTIEMSQGQKRSRILAWTFTRPGS